MALAGIGSATTAGIAWFLFTLLQASSLIAIARTEPNIPFLGMAYGLFLVRNTCWLAGLLKAIVYVVQSPPEFEEAARWRARRDDSGITEPVKEAQTREPPQEIERANAETVH